MASCSVTSKESRLFLCFVSKVQKMLVRGLAFILKIKVGVVSMPAVSVRLISEVGCPFGRTDEMKEANSR